MLSKEAMEKVAAADARDQAAAIEFGFEQACADMGLDRAHASGLAKVARARLAEFKKVAGEMLPPRPPAEVREVPNWMTMSSGEVRPLPNLGKAPTTQLPAPGTKNLGNGGGVGNFASKPAPKPAPVAPALPPPAPSAVAAK